MMKSAGKNFSPTLMSRSFNPFHKDTQVSCRPICRIIDVTFELSNPNFLQIDSGIILILALKSIKAFVLCKFCIEQGKMKIPISFSLGGSLCYRTVLHSLVKPLFDILVSLLFLINIFLI